MGDQVYCSSGARAEREEAMATVEAAVEGDATAVARGMGTDAAGAAEAVGTCHHAMILKDRDS